MVLKNKVMKQVVTDIYLEGWHHQQYDKFSGYLGSKINFNFRGSTSQVNLDGLKMLIASWKAAFPDLHYQIIDLVAENNLVAINLIVTGTHAGEWWGIPATGSKISFEEMMFYRFEDGKIVEIWEVYDESMLREQLTT